MIILSEIRRAVEKVRYLQSCSRASRSLALKPANQEWFHALHGDLWAHAGGGRFHLYGNSQEAFDDAIASGFSILEADVMMTLDNVPVMSHRFRPNFDVEFDSTPTVSQFLARKINGKYTPMTLEMFIGRYENRGVYVAIDPSPSLRSRFGSAHILDYLKCHASEDFQRHVIYQISGVKDMALFAHTEWLGALHYNLNHDISCPENAWRVDALIPALKAVGVGSVSYVDMPVTPSLVSAVSKFNEAGILVSVASVNSIERFNRLKKIGVSCIDTDYCYP